MKHLLIISNNVLSSTNNNGKTLYSFIDGLEDIEVFQLYFSAEIPKINKYKYFRISDENIIYGLIQKRKRGSEIGYEDEVNKVKGYSIKKVVKKNQLTQLIRDIIWHKHWISKNLILWLDKIKPDAIFFMAGDSLFSYEICNYVYQKYNSRLTVFITDDYIMPKKNESWLAKYRRNKIKREIEIILEKSSCFYTISFLMQQTYKQVFGKESLLIVNMTDDLKCDDYTKKENEIIFTYTGSFYYKRSEVLGMIARSIKQYNKENHKQQALLLLYSNNMPKDIDENDMCIDGGSVYKGSLNSEQLKERLNTSDVLVFVESFDVEQAEKVRFSLSTKIPEYLSIGKPIIAIGPKGISSIDYLEDVAVCVTDPANIQNAIFEIITNRILRERCSSRARQKFLCNHNKEYSKKQFYKNVFGG